MTSAEVAIIGGGPVGCVAALAFAERGAEVALLEACPERTKKLAGEWIHPPGRAVLERLGLAGELDALEHCEARGFALIPEDRSSPILLDYADRTRAFCAEHGALLELLRRRVENHPRVRFLAPARAVGIEGRRVVFKRPDGALSTLSAGRILGAEGRCSLVRKELGLSGEARILSLMAGLVLEDVECPIEGYGVIALGGPGPILAFRLDNRRLRLYLDVPVERPELRRSPAALLREYGPWMPSNLRTAFVSALDAGSLVWNVNRRLARYYRVRSGLSLIGDAVGHMHPLTAAGMAIGFVDAECAARCDDLGDYRRERNQQAFVPELLANSLYEVLSRPDRGAAILRQGIYARWRQSAGERQLTMRLLATSERRFLAFSGSFLRVFVAALRCTLIASRSNRSPHPLFASCLALCGLLSWPLRGFVVKAMRASGADGKSTSL